MVGWGSSFSIWISLCNNVCLLFCVRQSHKTINTKTKNALKKNNIVDKIPNTLFQTGTGKVKKKKKASTDP